MKTNLLQKVFIVLLISALLWMSFSNAQASNQASKGDQQGRLSGRASELLAEAIAKGEKTVILLIAAYPGYNSAVANGILSLGGSVDYREDDIDYIRATLATGLVEAAASLDGVQFIDLNEIIPLEDPRPDPEGIAPLIPQPPPGAATPLNNPYMPIGDTGAAQFMQANPTWDGRGVTIGILDTGITLDHPSLQMTSTGERKIIDWVTFTDPFQGGDAGDPTWVGMQIQVKGPSFKVNGVTYTAGKSGEFRFGFFSEGDPRLGGEVGSNVNRDGDTTDTFAVLWDTRSNTVWVDTNQNKNFSDDMGMMDYKVRYDVNYFGVDNPATAIAERMPFVVQTDGKHKFVNIGIISGAHGSHVAGIAAGYKLFGGSMMGAAPGAKIVSVRVCLFITGCTSFALIEGMIYAAKQSNVDVINMSIGGLPALNDGNNARAILYDRLIEQSNVQIFISAGNSGPGLNTVGDPSVATKVMSVGAYITDDTYLADYGTLFYEQDNLHNFSSRGPREDGGFKPNIVAPGAAISSTPMWQAGGGLSFFLPPGYALFNGTSMSSPQAAGAAALLVSAAQQYGAQHQPAQLRQALNSSARFLSGRYQAYEQGNGLVNVGAAWDLLKTNIKTVDMISLVPVSSLLSGFLKIPGYGEGIYDREGMVVGQAYTRTYTIIRTSGLGIPVEYNISWVGNDGTFVSAASIALPKNEPVDLVVTVTPASSGVHSAILNLDDPSNVGIEYQTMNTVIAGDIFTAANNYSVVKTDTLGPGQFKSFFFVIPPGTPAFKVDLSGPNSSPGTGQMRFLRWHPWGLSIDSNAVSNCYTLPTTACTTGTSTSRTTTNPQPGVWEVTVDARRNSDANNAPFNLTASILGASVSPNPDVIASATLGVPLARSYTLTNLLGAFTGRAVGTTLGSAFRATPSIANLEIQDYFVTVSAGSTSLRATIGSPSDPAADLDLFVYNCTSGTCVLAGLNADGDSEESVTIANPAAGLWRVSIEGFAVPAGSTTYNYVDVFVNPAFGSVSVTDANAVRPTAATWIVPGTVTANAAPGSGRVLLGAVQVRTDANILVGSGDVIVESVTP